MLHIFLLFYVDNICLFQFVICYRSFGFISNFSSSLFPFRGLLHQLKDSVTYLCVSGVCNSSCIFSFCVFGCICGSGSTGFCVLGALLGVPNSWAVGMSSVLFLNVIWGVSGGSSGSNSVTFSISIGGGVCGGGVSGWYSC